MTWFVGVLAFAVIVSLLTAIRRGEVKGWPRGHVRAPTDADDDR